MVLIAGDFSHQDVLFMSGTFCVFPFFQTRRCPPPFRRFRMDSRRFGSWTLGTDLWGSHESIGAEGKWLCSSGAPRSTVHVFFCGGRNIRKGVVMCRICITLYKQIVFHEHHIFFMCYTVNCTYLICIKLQYV